MRGLSPAPHCWGAGLVSIDIVRAEAGDVAALGGSCGNVLMLLSWLGWRATILARVGGGPGGEWISRQLEGNGVDTGYLYPEAEGKTPVIVQHFGVDRDGDPTHKFSLRCPNCRAYLPRHRAITTTQAMSFVTGAKDPSAFYFDRASPGSIRLAEEARRQEALVVFEPALMGDGKLFERAAKQCHILKYSYSQLGSASDTLPREARPDIVVETCGAAGLRFRLRGRWTHLAAVHSMRVVDAAGSGDWCSALMIHELVAGALGPERLDKAAVAKALRLGQKAAAVNCGHFGARGAMQELSLGDWLKRMSPQGLPALRMDNPPVPTSEPPAYCPACRTADGQEERTRTP